MQHLSLVQTIAVYALPLILAITLHEAAHGYVARYFGDHTAARLGRVTLNPLRHLDLVGTVLLPIFILVTSKVFGASGFLFGWAKPVPVNFHALRNPRLHMVYVAAVGPGINLVQAVVWAGLAKLAISLEPSLFTQPAYYVGVAGVTVNIVLAIVNLLPILPLDGGRILAGLLPPSLSASYSRLERFGLPLMICLVFLDSEYRILDPLYRFTLGTVSQLFSF